MKYSWTYSYSWLIVVLPIRRKSYTKKEETGDWFSLHDIHFLIILMSSFNIILNSIKNSSGQNIVVILNDIFRKVCQIWNFHFKAKLFQKGWAHCAIRNFLYIEVICNDRGAVKRHGILLLRQLSNLTSFYEIMMAYKRQAVYLWYFASSAIVYNENVENVIIFYM